MLRFLLALCATALFALPAAAEVEVPKNDDWVTDLAGMLSDSQEQQLELLMESYRQGSGHEIALLTVPDLGGESIERFALEVGRSWGLGEKEKNNGALLVVAKEERKIRIEVGRGLEGDLPDILAGRIIRDVITPAFKKGDFAGGLRDGVLAIHEVIGGDYARLENSHAERRREGRTGSIFNLVWILVLILVIATRGRRGGRGGSGSVLPWLLLGGAMSSGSRGGGGGFGGGGGGGFGGFGGGGGFSGGGASGGW